MAQHYLIAISVLIISNLLTGALSRPQENESRGGSSRQGLFGEFRRLSPAFVGTSDRFYYSGNFNEMFQKNNKTFRIFVGPTAQAVSKKGLAIANPVSQVFVKKDTSGTIVHAPQATAVAGPGGIAHAQSDFSRSSVEYFPFYGGAKGQYLEITKDNKGTVIKEQVVNEDSISNENVFKNRDENLISKVLGANLQNIQSLSASLLKLHNIGRRTGSLRRTDKVLFREQLTALGENASNLIKLIDEIGDDVDMLFRKNATEKRQINFDDDVGEEGVGIDSSADELGEVLSGDTIADAKPIGLAVVGQSGLAASRPMATAVAASGIALARPQATAIAGLDPYMLGIQFNVNGNKN